MRALYYTIGVIIGNTYEDDRFYILVKGNAHMVQLYYLLRLIEMWELLVMRTEKDTKA